jgi:hypothetical protein
MNIYHKFRFMLLGDLLNNWASLANIPQDQLTDLLAIKEVAMAEVADETANQLTGGILTKDSARANPEIRNHYFAQFNNGLDATVERFVGELPEEMRSDVNGQDKTTKKISRLLELQAELTKKAATSNTGDSKELNATIEALNNEIGTLKTGFEAERSNLQNGFNAQLLDRDVTSSLNGFTFADQYERSDALYLAKHKIDVAVRNSGLTISQEGGNLSLQKDGQDFYENNQKVSYNDFASKVLAENKLLKTTNNDPTPNPNPIPSPTPSPNSGAWASKMSSLTEAAQVDLNS